MESFSRAAASEKGQRREAEAAAENVSRKAEGKQGQRGEARMAAGNFSRMGGGDGVERPPREGATPDIVVLSAGECPALVHILVIVIQHLGQIGRIDGPTEDLSLIVAAIRSPQAIRQRHLSVALWILSTVQGGQNQTANCPGRARRRTSSCRRQASAPRTSVD